jgi:hypothetical protein
MPNISDVIKIMIKILEMAKLCKDMKEIIIKMI